MPKRTVSALSVSIAVVVCSLAAHAAPVVGEKKVVAHVVRAAASATILGTVWDALNRPVPNVMVRLRNVTTAKIEATTRANEVGRFTFLDIEGDNYVVEVLNDEARVIAVGRTFLVAPGETVATFVRLGARLPWFAGFFNNAAISAVTSAASLGVTAVAPTGQASTPER
jgi:hypothetical protein